MYFIKQQKDVQMNAYGPVIFQTQMRRYKGVQTNRQTQDSRDYWVSELCPSPGIIKNTTVRKLETPPSGESA
jgi:hypothetical protein